MKGLVIANCGAMGLDWERLSMSGYLEAVDARSRADGGARGVPADMSDIKRFMIARGEIGHA